MIYVLIAVLIAIAVVFYLKSSSRFYDKFFSDEHFTEIIDWLQRMLKLGPIEDPQEENRTAFRTSGNCGLTFTRDIDEKDTIHIAISQVGRPTTHAASHRIAFLIIQALAPNDAAIDFFSTPSTIHPLLLQKEADGEWLTTDAATAVGAMKSYEPPQCRPETINSLASNL